MQVDQLELAKNLIDIISPKKGKAPDFVVMLSDNGRSVYVRCLNGKSYGYRPRLLNGMEAEMSISTSECTITPKNDHPFMSVAARGASDVDGDKVVLIDVMPCPNCGGHPEVVIRVPKNRTVALVQLGDVAEVGSRHPFSSRSSIRDILSALSGGLGGILVGGGPGVFSGSPEEFASMLEAGLGARPSDRPSERHRRREEPVGADRGSRSNGDGRRGHPAGDTGGL